MNDAFWDDARTYDLATGSFVADLPYWEALVAENRPRRVLDLGCGTGRITIPLVTAAVAAHDEAEVVGLDSSRAFLRATERKLAASPHAGRIRLIEGDMRDFDLGEPFDLVVCGYNNLAYLHETADHLACFRAVRRHLAPGGLFAFDVQTPNLAMLAEARAAVFPTVRRELDWLNPAPGIARFSAFFVTARYDLVTQTEHSTHYWEIVHEDGRRESYVKDLSWHHYFPRELALLFQRSGLAAVAKYGTYARDSFGESSPSYLWVMTEA
jgi:SAM-dependent methyltransferase